MGVDRVELRLLGPIAVVRNGVVVALPRSRKVRALLAYLALSPVAITRSRLCDLLWDVPNDPRGELRWCLSKLRGVLDDERARVVTDAELVSLDLSDVRVDATDIGRAAKRGFDQIDQAELGELCDRFGGNLLEGIELDHPELTGWLAAQRARYRSLHVQLLRALVRRAGPDETYRRLEAWLQIAPFDPEAHEVMLEALAKAGRIADAEQHLAATIRSFESEGVDWTQLRDRWQALRAPRPPTLEVAGTPPPAAEKPRRRASVAVMPFVDRAATQPNIADGLTEDIIMQLARLRVLFVIARGSVFALAERGVGAHEAARVLDVDYVVTGTVRRAGDRIIVGIELADARNDRIVWTDSFDAHTRDALTGLADTVGKVVAAIAEEIETEETRRAVLKPPTSLDAWEAYHRGLWHMYKFTGDDNKHAGDLFRRALALDPTFSRAHAGLSFTHFQNTLLALTPDHDRQIQLAFETANDALSADDHDPAAHWAMGRALWLRNEHDESLVELGRSVELCPNFALGHYTLGFVHSQRGDPKAAIDATNYSRQLSPFDPLQFAMLASRAVAHIRLDERAEAAEWAVKATARPNAHTHIYAIAAQSLALANRLDDGRRFVARIRQRQPNYKVDDFLRAFRYDRDMEKLFRHTASRIGFD